MVKNGKKRIEEILVISKDNRENPNFVFKAVQNFPAESCRALTLYHSDNFC